MANPSLYRRYRPRKFSELKGQDHVVRALRDAVAHGREGQAYMFSGPRGTGKTTSARILAKVLNCADPDDGEPCGECESCLAIDRGVSYDVHELDAASNNGVDAIRDLIEKASLGSPGRHKVYILDEVHMLSKPAEAALLKTLEEPPPHVVFVLATTDPQKVSETIRSRTMHLRFHLFDPDVLTDHLTWLAADAGLEVSEAAIDSAVTQGAGSARDALSALELIASTGDTTDERVDSGAFLDALIARSPGEALTAMASASKAGHDARTIADAVVRHLRDAFLSLMAPELVQLPTPAVDELAGRAQRLGPAGIVAAIERLGEILVEFRHAPDPRVLVEVALVQLTHEPSEPDDGTHALVARVARLEDTVARAAPAHDERRDPTTGRVEAGGRARAARPGSSAPPPAVAPTATSSPSAASAPIAAATSTSARASTGPMVTAPATTDLRGLWEHVVRPGLKGIVRARYSPLELTSIEGDVVTMAAPTAPHRDQCAQHQTDVAAAFSMAAGRAITVELVVGGPSAGNDPTHPTRHRPNRSGPVEEHPTDDEIGSIDLDQLVDAPPIPKVDPLDRVRDAFPGAKVIEDGD